MLGIIIYAKSLYALDIMRHVEEPESSVVVAVVAGDLPAVENILLTHPDWVSDIKTNPIECHENRIALYRGE